MHLFGGKFCTSLRNQHQPCTCDVNGQLTACADPMIVGDFLSKTVANAAAVSGGSGHRSMEGGGRVVATAAFRDLDHTCMARTSPDACVCDRKNFDNFLWATVTVFQVTFSYRVIPSS